MANINHLKERLARMRYKAKKQKMERAGLYANDRLKGMTYAAIAEKHGVSTSAVAKGCARYRKILVLEEIYGK